jgi:hypothetical protein
VLPAPSSQVKLLITSNAFWVVQRAKAQSKTGIFRDYGVAEAPPGFQAPSSVTSPNPNTKTCIRSISKRAHALAAISPQRQLISIREGFSDEVANVKERRRKIPLLADDQTSAP